MPPFLVWKSFVYFFLFFIFGLGHPVLSGTVQGGCLCLIPELREKAFCLSPFHILFHAIVLHSPSVVTYVLSAFGVLTAFCHEKMLHFEKGLYSAFRERTAHDRGEHTMCCCWVWFVIQGSCIWSSSIYNFSPPPF